LETGVETKTRWFSTEKAAAKQGKARRSSQRVMMVFSDLKGEWQAQKAKGRKEGGLEASVVCSSDKVVAACYFVVVVNELQRVCEASRCKSI